MSTKQKAIIVKDVKKNFQLPHERNSSLKQSFTQLFKKKDRTIEVQHALRGVSFDIRDGEFFGILGRNGSGKSTMLKMLANIYTPSSGSVQHFGKLVPFIELGVGFNPELTGRENVFLNGALLGFSRKEIAEKYDEIVAFAELEEFMDQKLKNYSSGMQVRLAFSVATRAEADILLVDEVLAVGDADFQRKCFQYFRQLKKQKKTVVFVSHDMSSVREFCDRAVLIDEGKVIFEGEAPKVANEYMRLFNDPNRQVSKGKQQESKARWGAGPAKVKSIQATDKGSHVEVTATITSDAPAEGVVMGFRVKNSAGKNITGTNTLVGEHVPINIKAKGDTAIFTWSLSNIFSTDLYSIDTTVRLSDNTICENWDDATKFEVVRDVETPYLTAPEVTLSIDRGVA